MAMTRPNDNDARFVGNTIFEVTHKVNETINQAMIAQQKLWQSSLTGWETYNQSFLDLFIKGLNQLLEQSLSLREQVDGLIEDNLKKVQEITIVEEEVFFEAAEEVQPRLQATSERVVKIFSSISTS